MTIPDNAELVFKGILYDVYHWKQKQFDGSFDTFEGLKRKSSVQIIAVSGDKLIILEEEQPSIGKFLSVPGGVFEQDESPESAAERELLEETGYEAESLVPWINHYFSVDIEWNTHYFIAKKCKRTTEQKMDPGEKINVRMVLFDEFVKEVLSDEFRNKHLANMLGIISCDKNKIEEFKRLLFE